MEQIKKYAMCLIIGLLLTLILFFSINIADNIINANKHAAREREKREPSSAPKTMQNIAKRI